MSPALQEKVLIEKIRHLSPQRVVEVEDFIDFLRQRDEDLQLTQASARLSEAAFSEVWNNDEDAVYDDL